MKRSRRNMQKPPTAAATVQTTMRPSVPHGGNAQPRAKMGGVLLDVGVERSRGDELRSYLVQYGVFAISTPSAVTALELLRRGDLFDAIILELRGPEGAIWHVVGQIRALRRDIPMVVVTEHAMAVSEKADHHHVHVVTSGTPAGSLARQIFALIERAQWDRVNNSGTMWIGPRRTPSGIP